MFPSYNQEKTVDFDDEGLKLIARLGIEKAAKTIYNELDMIYKHKSGAALYIGNQTAAQSLAILSKNNISQVVNCTHNMPNFHEGSGKITYLRFDIALWSRYCTNDEALKNFVSVLYLFIGTALESGKSVLCHCLAVCGCLFFCQIKGAHRAGTTGILSLMKFGNLSMSEAIRAAKLCRPIIDPIGSFPDLLIRTEKLLKNDTDKQAEKELKTEK